MPIWRSNNRYLERAHIGASLYKKTHSSRNYFPTFVFAFGLGVVCVFAFGLYVDVVFAFGLGVAFVSDVAFFLTVALGR